MPLLVLDENYHTFVKFYAMLSIMHIITRIGAQRFALHVFIMSLELNMFATCDSYKGVLFSHHKEIMDNPVYDTAQGEFLYDIREIDGLNLPIPSQCHLNTPVLRG